VIDLSETQLSLLLTDGRTRIALLQDSRPLAEQAPPLPDGLSALIVNDPYPSQWISSLRPAIRIAVGHPRDTASWQLRTEQHGWIELTSDGERLWVSAEHAVEIIP
jgi:hypothetical protein